MNAPDPVVARMASQRDQLDQIEVLVRRYLSTGVPSILFDCIGDALEETKYRNLAPRVYMLAVEALNYEGESEGVEP